MGTTFQIGSGAFYCSGRLTDNSDRTAATFTQSLIGGMEATGHEAETLFTKKTHHHKICPAPTRPRARQIPVLNSLTSLDAQRGYRHAIDEFVDGIVRNLVWLSTEL